MNQINQKTQWILDNWVSPILLLLIVVFGLALCSGCATATAAESSKKASDLQTNDETLDKLTANIAALKLQIEAARKKLLSSETWKDYDKQRIELLKKIVTQTPEWKELNRLEAESTRLKNIQTYLRKTLK